MAFDIAEQDGDFELLFTENETNMERLFDTEHYTKYYKDAFHRYVINGMFSNEFL